MEKGKFIGKGRTAEVFEWGEDRILKLYFNFEHVDYMYNREMENTVEINRLELPAPYMYDVIELEGRKGLIYERLFGKSLLSLSQKRLHMAVPYTRRMARLHHKVHQAVSDNLERVKDQLAYGIRRSADFGVQDVQYLLDALDRLPDMNNVCHGDFHPDNIMATKKGWMIIDWMNAAAGDPAFDVARTLLMLKTPYLPPDIPKPMARIIRLFKKRIFSVYLKKYMAISGMSPDRINACLLPVAAARLQEQVPGEQEWLLRIIAEKRNIYTCDL